MKYKAFNNEIEVFDIFKNIMAQYLIINKLDENNTIQGSYKPFVEKIDNEDFPKNIHYNKNFIDILTETDLVILVTKLNSTQLGRMTTLFEKNNDNSLKNYEFNGKQYNNRITLNTRIETFKFELAQPVRIDGAKTDDIGIRDIEYKFKNMFQDQIVQNYLREKGISNNDTIANGKYNQEDRITNENETGVERISVTYSFMYCVKTSQMIESIPFKVKTGNITLLKL